MTAGVSLVEAGPTPQDVLEAGLAEYYSRAVRIVGMAGEPLHGGTGYQLQRLRVTLASGETLSMVFKRLLPDPDPVGKTYLREVLIYRRLLANGRFDAPALYASLQDEARDRYWLFIEDLGNRTLQDAYKVEDWLAAARWLAALHSAYAGREEELRSLGCLGEHNPRFYHTLAAKARSNLAAAGAPGLARFDELMSRYESVVHALVSRPRSLVHGDFAPHNVALQKGGRIRAMDWEWAAIGPGGWDLARLFYYWGGSRATLRDEYVSELVRLAVQVERAEIADSVRRCEFVYKVWILSQQPDVCRDPVRVNALLDEMEAAR